MSEIKNVINQASVYLNEEDQLVIIDQTQLPNRLIHLVMNTPEDCYKAIYLLQVRGAPAIGIFAGYSMYVLSKPLVDLP